MRLRSIVNIELAEEAAKIIDGYWHEWVSGEWVNTGIKAEGEDGSDGIDAKYIDLSGKTTLKNAGRPGGDNATIITAVKHGFDSTVEWQWLSSGGSWQATGWRTDSVTVDYSVHPGMFVNNVCTLKCYSLVDSTVFATISINVVRDGEDAKYMEISGNTVLKNAGKPGGVDSTVLTATRYNFSGLTLKWEFMYFAIGAWQATQWSTDTITVAYNSGVFQNNLALLKCSVMSDPTIFATISLSIVNDGEDGGDGIAVFLGITSSGIKVASDSFAIPATISIPIFAYKGNVRHDIPASQISNPQWMPYGMNVSKSTNLIQISATSVWSPIAEQTVINVTFDGVVYPLVFRWYPISDGQPGRGIVSIFEQYYLSNSNTAQTGGSWQNSVPVWTEGKHVWTSSLITYSDSPTPVRVNITLVPSLGGTAITKIDVEYSRSQSASVIPTTGWQTNAPLAQKGWYIWTRTKITYSNGVIKYSGEACISGHDGDDGQPGDSVIIRYMRSENRPATPATGNLNPSGWMSQIDNPVNGDIYWPGFIGGWTRQANGEYKSKAIEHNENSPLRFNFYNRTAGSELKLTVRTSSESYDRLHVGKLDESLGENYANARVSFGGTQSQELTYSLPAKGEHYILFDYKKDSSVSSGSDAAFVKIDLPIQSVWMTTCNVVDGVATAWSRPSLFIDHRIEETIAASDRSKAITDKFGTTFEGGLVQTVMMLLREANTQTVTAGVSGIQGINRNHPAFWAGGTAEQAILLIEFLAKIAQDITPDIDEYFSLARITMLHNGAAKIGDFIVEESGRVTIVDPSTGKARIVFSQSDIPALRDLLDSTSLGDYVSTAHTVKSIQHNSLPVLSDISGAINVAKDGSDIRIRSFDVSLYSSYGGNDSGTYYSYVVELRNNKGMVQNIDSGWVDQHRLQVSHTTVGEKIFKNMPAAIYWMSIRLEAHNDDGEFSSADLNVGASRITWSFTQAGIRYIQFGLNGLMAFYSNNHLHFTENGGLDVKGATNMPGVLHAGSVSTAGTLSNQWGAKKKTTGTAITRPSTGVFNVFHSIGHSSYSVSLTPDGEHLVAIKSKTNTYFVVETRARNTGSLQWAGFDFVVIGSNYP